MHITGTRTKQRLARVKVMKRRLAVVHGVERGLRFATWSAIDAIRRVVRDLGRVTFLPDGQTVKRADPWQGDVMERTWKEPAGVVLHAEEVVYGLTGLPVKIRVFPFPGQDGAAKVWATERLFELRRLWEQTKPAPRLDLGLSDSELMRLI